MKRTGRNKNTDREQVFVMVRVVRGTLRDRRSRRRRRCWCHSILSQVFVALSPCQLDFSCHMFDLQQLKMNLIKNLRDSKFSGFFISSSSLAFFHSICVRRTYAYHFVHTYTTFFARLFFTFSQLQVVRIFMSETRTTRHDTIAASSCQITDAFRHGKIARHRMVVLFEWNFYTRIRH